MTAKTEDYQYNVFTNANTYSGGGIKNATLIEKEGKHLTLEKILIFQITV